MCKKHSRNDIKAIDLNGKPDIIVVEVMENESEATYTELFNSIKKRGARKGMALCIRCSYRVRVTGGN